MMSVFSYVRLAIMVSACFIVSLAQGTDQGLVNRAATRLTEQMKSELSLTADQVPKVQQANLSTARQFAQLIAKHNQKPGDKTGFATEAVAIANSRESQLKQVLTQAQFEEYDSKKPERAAAIQTHIMTLQLSLTDQQIPQVEQINLAAATKMFAMLAGGNVREESRREKFKTVKSLESVGEMHDSELKKVLTEAQWQTYEQHKDEMPLVMKAKIQ